MLPHMKAHTLIGQGECEKSMLWNISSSSSASWTLVIRVMGGTVLKTDDLLLRDLQEKDPFLF